MKNSSFMKDNVSNIIFKILVFGLEFINISLIINYLGDEIYGEWVTIITVFAWINSCDLGIGNGLRNALAIEHAKGNSDNVRRLISTSYILISIMGIVFLIFGIVFSSILTKINFYSEDFLIPLIICVIGFTINFIIGLSRSIGYGYQKSSYVFGTQLFTSLLVLGSVFFLEKYTECNLILFVGMYMMAMIIPNCFLMGILKFKHKNEFVISTQLFSKKYTGLIAGLGIKFFILQILSLLMYSTDTIILKIFLGTKSVTEYDIINKIYKAGNELFSVLLVATWSAVTYQFSKKNFKWIHDSVRILIKIWIVFSIGVFVVMFITNPLISIWLQSDEYKFSFTTCFVFAIHCILTAWNGIFINISNGLGRLKVQLVSSMIAVLVNIPVSIFLVKSTGLGINGVKVGTIISLLFMTFPLTIDIIKYIKNNIK